MTGFRLVLLLAAFPLWLCGQGADSLAVSQQIDSLIQVSRDLTGKRDFEQALAVNGEAERLALERFGRESAEYGRVCFNRGEVMHDKTDFSEAENWYTASKEIYRIVIGEAAPDYVSNLIALGVLYKDLGQYEEAKKMFIEANNIRSVTLGTNHPDYANGLNNLAVVYSYTGDYEKSKSLYIEAKDIRGKILGKRHQSYAFSLSNIALLLSETGSYESAEPLYLEALSILEEILGTEDPLYAQSLNNLALLYHHLGNYQKAEVLYASATDTWKMAFGEEDTYYGFGIANMANLYSDMGNFKKAELLYQKAKSIWGKSLGENHPYYANIISDLANLYLKLGAYDKAEPLYNKALLIKIENIGVEHPDYAITLGNLASLKIVMGDYVEADSLLTKAVSIIEKMLGEGHRLNAANLSNLGNLYSAKDIYHKADSFYLAAKNIWQSVFGKNHPDYIMSLGNVAQSRWQASTPNQSLRLYQEISALTQSLITKASHHLSERELNNYLQTFSKRQNEILSFTQQPDFRASELTHTCYDNSLFFKGFLLHNAGRLQHIALTDSLTTEAYYQLKAYKRRLSAEYAKPIAERKNVEELEEKANAIEKELARSVAGFEAATRQVTWQEVQSALPPGAAAIEFVHYRYMTPKETDSTMYAALVLLPGAAAPAFILLCEERELTSLLDSSGASTFYAGLYRGETKFVPLHTDKAQGKALYDLIWQPLEELLQGTKAIHYAPSGLLHRLNLAAIKTPSDSLLGERHHLITLGSTRQLVPEATIRPETLGQEIALFGGIHFEADSTLAPPPIDSTAIPAGMIVSRSAAIDSTQRQSTWPYLKGTAREVQNIHDTLARKGLPVRLHTGHEATEEALKQLGEAGQLSPRVLHLATHGFFSPDPKAISRNMDGEPVFKWSDNPMMRSGLVLAGGNHAWQHGRPLYPGLEDGILTAQEITQMNLRNTELVVLSACETGLGDIQGNEGVYGLQRAFKIAGAQYLIMSLWKVPDEETAEFMEAFYGHWLSADGKKVSIPDAFRMTQEGMREKYRMEPRKWAGFVLVE